MKQSVLDRFFVKVWQQNNAIPSSHEEYRSVQQVYTELSGTPYDIDTSLKTWDHGDEFHRMTNLGWVVVMSGAGNSRIYRPVSPVNPACVRDQYVFGTINTFRYTNHREETTIRVVVPLSVEFGSHKEVCPKSNDHESQWLLVCYDLEKDAIRHFALKHVEPR